MERGRQSPFPRGWHSRYAARAEVGKLPAQDVAPNDVVANPLGCRQRITCTSAEDLVFLAICTSRFRREVYEDIDPAPR